MAKHDMGGWTFNCHDDPGCRMCELEAELLELKLLHADTVQDLEMVRDQRDDAERRCNGD